MNLKDLYDIVHEGDLKKVVDWIDRYPEHLNAQIRDGYTPLHVACIFGHEAIVDYLVTHYALVNVNAENPSRATPLHLAVNYRDEDAADRMAKMLIANGAELNAKQSEGLTPLHHAVARGSLKLTQTLVRSGADPFFKDDLGRSPSDLARELAQSKPEAPAAEIQAILKEAFSLEI